MTTTSSVYTDNVILHPIRAIRRALRRWSLTLDKNATNPATGDFASPGTVPPNLEHFFVGEVLPWKGVRFKVGKVVGGDFPCLILVPAGVTHGTKLRTLRTFRDLHRGGQRVQ